MKKVLLIFSVYFVTLYISAQDSSWLADTNQEYTNQLTESLNTFLKQLNGHMRLILCKYDGNKLIQKNTFAGNTAEMPASKWQVSITHAKSSSERDVIEFTVAFKIVKGIEKSTGVAVAFDFDNWTLQNYVFAPAMLYGGNRFKILETMYPGGDSNRLAFQNNGNLGNVYPPYIYNPQDRPLDMPVTTTNILHLNKDGSPAKVEMLTGNCATPMLGFFNPEKQRAFLLLTEQGTRFGNSGMFVEDNIVSKKGTFVITAPGVREQRYVMCGRANSGDVAADWTAGDEVRLKFRIYITEIKGIPDFFEKVFDVRKSLSGKNTYCNVTPYSAVSDMILKLNDSTKWYQDDKYTYLCDEPSAKEPFFHMQIGWSGGATYSIPYVIKPTPERINKVARMVDSWVSFQSRQTGLFYANCMKGQVYGDNFDQMAERPFIAMTRRTADAIYFGIQQTEIIRKQGYGNVIKPGWDSCLHKAADALVNVWKKYGQFGRTINVETGEMEENGSTAGAASVGALALASEYFNEPVYLDIAKKACRYYYERDFKKGYAGGGASEILQSPDSETPWDMAESAISLYELTGEKEWLEIAKDAVYMLATWTVSYDYKFPDDCDLGRSNCHSTGAIFASSQNNHGAPGLYILSGDFLLKLYRATNDKRFAELYKDMVHNVIQYVNTKYNPTIRNATDGYCSERVNLSDWEGKEEIGNTWPGVARVNWATLELLTSLQNPGIYIRPDLNELLVLDHVEASIVKLDRNSVTLKVTNPTPYDAQVSVLSENAEQVKTPLGMYSYLTWKKIDVKAGETGTFIIFNQ